MLESLHPQRDLQVELQKGESMLLLFSMRPDHLLCKFVASRALRTEGPNRASCAHQLLTKKLLRIHSE